MTVVVTGGGAGIGQATVELLVASGFDVVVIDRDVAGVAQTTSVNLKAVSGDVTDVAFLESVFATVAPITGVVACAGLSRPAPSNDYRREDWDDLIGVNLTAVFETFRIAARYVAPSASFVAISSISGAQGFSGRAAYSATKAGVEGLVRSLAVEFAPHIRVNAVAPGYVMTDLVRRNLELGVISEKAILARTPLERWGRPSDIAESIGFLLSDASSWTTGTVLTVDGGWLAYGLGDDIE